MARYEEGIELTTRVGSNEDLGVPNMEDIEWSKKPFEDLLDVEENKVPGCMSNFLPSYLDIFLKVELHEAHKEHQTTYVYDANKEKFALDEKHKPSIRYLVKGLDLYNLHMRVVLMEFSSVGKDTLIGYNKKFDLEGEMLTSGQPVYAKVPTSEDGTFTGYVYLEFDLLQEEELLKVRVMGCSEVNYEPPDPDCSCFELKIGAFIIAYICVYALVMHLVQGPEAVEGGDCGGYDDFRFCLWFVLVTFSSVGYGDMYPCTDTGRLLNTLFILLNQVTLAWFFSIATRLVLIQKNGYAMVADMVTSKMPDGLCSNCGGGDSQKFEQKDLVLCRDSHGDVRTAMVLHVHRKFDEEEGEYDYAYTLQWKDGAPDDIFVELEEDVRKLDPLTHARLWEELKITVLKNIVFIFICLLFGCLVFYATEHQGWNNGTQEVGCCTVSENDSEQCVGQGSCATLTHTNTLHFAIVTMSTVGYGDWAPATRIGRAIGAFYILLGVTVLGNFAGLAVGYVGKRSELVNSEDFLNNSLITPTQLFEFDLNGDGEITKYEYLVKSLLACQFVTEDKIDLIMTKFHDIDTDKSGVISTEDFAEYTEGNGNNGGAIGHPSTQAGQISPNNRNIAVEIVANDTNGYY